MTTFVRLDMNSLRDTDTPDDYKAPFAVPPARTTHLQIQVCCPDGVWYWPEIVFLADNGDGTYTVLSSEKLDAPVQVVGTGWVEMNHYYPAAERATHFVYNLRLSESDPRGGDSDPVTGKEVFFDCAYVPDNGFDLVEWKQPYLDGDQSYGIWEGERHNATSIFGTKPPEGVVLGQGLIVSDAPPPPPPLPEACVHWRPVSVKWTLQNENRGGGWYRSYYEFKVEVLGAGGIACYPVFQDASGTLHNGNRAGYTPYFNTMDGPVVDGVLTINYSVDHQDTTLNWVGFEFWDSSSDPYTNPTHDGPTTYTDGILGFTDATKHYWYFGTKVTDQDPAWYVG